MEALRLFRVSPEDAVTLAVGDHASAREPDEAAWHEAELFLADRVERDGDLARIQAALSLCEPSGVRGHVALRELTLDRHRFPRSVSAIERVLELLNLPVADRPDGFWPRFLLEQLEEPGRA